VLPFGPSFFICQPLNQTFNNLFVCDYQAYFEFSQHSQGGIIDSQNVKLFLVPACPGQVLLMISDERIWIQGEKM